MQAASATYLSHLRLITPAGALRLNHSSRAASATPPLWYESDVVWAIPSVSVGPPYPVAFCNLNATASVCNIPHMESSSAVGAQRYAPPFTFNDAPGWNLSHESHGKQHFILFLSCTHNVLPFAGQILRGLGVKVPSAVGPACPGLGSHCKVETTGGSRTVHLKYFVVVPNTRHPWDAAFHARDLE